jgi:hypothetical protein
MIAFKKVPVNKLNDAQKRQCSFAVNNLLELSTLSILLMVFADEKNFQLSAPTNAQNDRVYTAGKKKSINTKRLLRYKPFKTDESFSQIKSFLDHDRTSIEALWSAQACLFMEKHDCISSKLA